MKRIYTIGHSNHSIERFCTLLSIVNIDVVADVRSVPFSQYNPQFNRDNLKRSLNAQKIRYLFMGKELGARCQDESCYLDGRVVYHRLAGTPLFEMGIERLLKGSGDYNIALMCAEKEPLECHRTILVANALHSSGVDIQHILASGVVESHDDTMGRLLALCGLPQEDLFKTRNILINEALLMQEARIAFVDESLKAQSKGGE